MQGARSRSAWKSWRWSLRKVHVIFPGYLAGLEKQAHFRLADLYVFPSRHESCGLTLLEAFLAGLPAVACTTPATRRSSPARIFGELLPSAKEEAVPELLPAYSGLPDLPRLKTMGIKARALPRAARKTARRLAAIIAPAV